MISCAIWDRVGYAAVKNNLVLMTQCHKKLFFTYDCQEISVSCIINSKTKAGGTALSQMQLMLYQKQKWGFVLVIK